MRMRVLEAGIKHIHSCPTTEPSILNTNKLLADSVSNKGLV
jgi:hypothetical protein